MAILVPYLPFPHDLWFQSDSRNMVLHICIETRKIIREISPQQRKIQKNGLEKFKKKFFKWLIQREKIEKEALKKL